MIHKDPRYFNAAECMVWMYAANSGKIDIYMPGEHPRYLISIVPVSLLKFPEGWYYSSKNKTINKEDSNIAVRIEEKYH